MPRHAQALGRAGRRAPAHLLHLAASRYGSRAPGRGAAPADALVVAAAWCHLGLPGSAGVKHMSSYGPYIIAAEFVQLRSARQQGGPVGKG